ncbi:uncharacterized protein CMU_003190 [Cryptosporidium muris RN66]|uniref:Uncharacterized protein n=1 Tax=Cryptosporidium muris (strain RN66) TaxID=441375 RepID=B6AJU8_CRYMR|nr:uncharacterized protein CMU_003190 [Cryptosporidium muris RN66]EEA08489.1 hypothetical protein, conserved [Cryptosporidium muris RN66]|eukprot:XP_002142838.1 hypothetical protein [Cryptosporidium muris RN66]
MDEFELYDKKLKALHQKERDKQLKKNLQATKRINSYTRPSEDKTSKLEYLYFKQQLSEKKDTRSWFLKYDKELSKSLTINYGETDRVSLPIEILSSLSNDNDDNSYPLLFKLEVINNDRCESDESSITHCSVLDFSSSSGKIGLPNKVLRCLKINNTSLDNCLLIRIEYVRLCKASYALFELVQNYDRILNLPNIKPLLESYLRDYFSTLTKNDTLIIYSLHSKLRQEPLAIVKVKQIEPEDATCIINTDLAIDLITSDINTLNENEDNNGINKDDIILNISDVLKFQFKESKLNEDIGKYNNKDKNNKYEAKIINNIESNKTRENYYTCNSVKILIPFEIRKLLTERNNNKIVTINISIESNFEFEFFVSFPPLMEASKHLHYIRSYPENNNQLNIKYQDILDCLPMNDFRNSLNPFNLDQRSENNLGFSQPLDFFPSILNITFLPIQDITDSNQLILGTFRTKLKIEESNELVVSTNNKDEINTDEITSKINMINCTNCNRLIPNESLTTHSLHCQRLYSKCEICGIIMKKVELKQHIHCNICNLGIKKELQDHHIKLYHTTIECGLCNESIAPVNIKLHQLETCSKRIILCRFCGNHVEAGIDDHIVDFKDKYYYNLTSHESYCGSKTINCDICHKFIPMKEIYEHKVMVHRINNVT